MPERHIGELEVELHSFLTSALEGVSDLLHALGVFLLEQEPMVPTEQETGRTPELVWMLQTETNLSPLSETEPQFPRRPVHCIITIPSTTSNKMFPHTACKHSECSQLLSILSKSEGGGGHRSRMSAICGASRNKTYSRSVLPVLATLSWSEQQANTNFSGKPQKPAAESLLHPHAVYRDDSSKNCCVRLVQPIWKWSSITGKWEALPVGQQCQWTIKMWQECKILNIKSVCEDWTDRKRSSKVSEEHSSVAKVTINEK